MNTEPDEYHCACPPGYSGKTCQMGEPVFAGVFFSYFLSFSRLCICHEDNLV